MQGYCKCGQKHTWDECPFSEEEAPESMKCTEEQYEVVSSIDGEIYMKGNKEEVTEWLWKNSSEIINKI